MSEYITSLRGTLMAGTVGEIFIHTQALESFAEPSAVAQDVMDAWDATWAGPDGAIANLFPASVQYTEATAAFILDLVAGDVSAAFHAPATAGMIGTDASGAMPSQVSLAVSLTAGQRANGSPIKGRFYLPGPARAQIDTASGLLVTTAQQAIADAIQGFHSALVAQGHTPCVWSRVMGALSPVQTVRVGNRLDTIRSRRNSAAEIYLQ